VDEKALLQNVKLFLSIYKESQQSADLDALQVRRLHKLAVEEFKKALQPFGFYAINIESTLEENKSNIRSEWTAKYNVSLGQPIPILNSDVTITGEGSQNNALREFVYRFPLKPGAVLVHKQYEAFKIELIKYTQKIGYLNAKFMENKININLEKYIADIIIRFDTGPRYHFGKIKFLQIGDPLNETLLYRYIAFKEGSTYDASALLELQSSLSNSEYFSRIEVNPLIDEADNLAVPLEIRLTMRKKRSYHFGIGYGTNSGARASIEHQRRLNRNGHIITLRGKTSERINRVDVLYSIPLKKPASEHLALSTYYLSQTTESRESKATAVDIRRITGLKSWQQSIALTFERESYEIANESGSSNLIMPNVEWTRNKFNNRLYPTFGTRFTAEIWTANKIWYSDVNFSQIKLSAKYIIPFFNKNRFIFKAIGGGTYIKHITSLPASRRFYAGGDQSIRGYGYEELGPTDSQGNIIGGKYLAVAGIEYENQIFQNWGVAIFSDGGYSFNQFSDNIYRSVGIGLRWRSKIGPIRLDFGWPLDKKVDYPRLHFIIGFDL